MTSHSPRTMMEMSKNCSILHMFIFLENNLVQIPWEKMTSKVENLVFYKHETAVLFAEGFAEKFLFLVSNTKLAEVVQLLLPDPLGKRGAIKSDLRIEVPVCLPGSPSNWVWRSFQQSVLDSSGPKESAGSIYSSCAKVEGCSGRMCGSAREHPAT